MKPCIKLSNIHRPDEKVLLIVSNIVSIATRDAIFDTPAGSTVDMVDGNSFVVAETLEIIEMMLT